MKSAKIFLVVLFLAPIGSASAADAAGIFGAPECHANCVAVTRTGEALLFVAKGRRGQILAVQKLSLPDDARLLGSGKAGRTRARSQFPTALRSGLPVGSICGSVSGVCTEHSSQTYETASQFVIVSITYFFYDGNLQDIDVDETRINKSKIK